MFMDKMQIGPMCTTEICLLFFLLFQLKTSVRCAASHSLLHRNSLHSFSFCPKCHLHKNTNDKMARCQGADGLHGGKGGCTVHILMDNIITIIRKWPFHTTAISILFFVFRMQDSTVHIETLFFDNNKKRRKNPKPEYMPAAHMVTHLGARIARTRRQLK